MKRAVGAILILGLLVLFGLNALADTIYGGSATYGAASSAQSSVSLDGGTITGVVSVQGVSDGGVSINGPNGVVVPTGPLTLQSSNFVAAPSGSGNITEIQQNGTDSTIRISGNRAAGSGITDVIIRALATRTAGNVCAITNNGSTVDAFAFHGGQTITQLAVAGGVNPILAMTGGAHTLQTATTESPDLDLNLSHSVQWATGSFATQRAVRIQAPTYTAQGAMTISDAATLAITAAPTCTTNMTCTRVYPLWTQAGTPRFDSSTANGSVATVLGSVGPVGSNTTVQGWLTINVSGTVRYIPYF